jgi:hypothetical protein
VLVVARVANQRDILGSSRHIGARRVASPSGVCTEEKFSGLVLIVEIRLICRAAPVQRIEIKPRRAEIFHGIGVSLSLERRHWIERDVVVNKLAEIGIPCWDGRIFVFGL